MKEYVLIDGSSPYGEYSMGDEGFISGYVTVDGVPYAVVCLKRNNRFVTVPINILKFMFFKGEEI